MMKKNASGQGISRRGLLKGMGIATLAGAAGLSMAPAFAKERSVRISNFGGFFEKAFKEHVYPAFTQATGIKIVSSPQSASEQFLMQLSQSNKAGSVPMDICCVQQSDLLRGRSQGLWKTVAAGKVPNLGNLMPAYRQDAGADVDNVAAMGWYLTFVTNTEEVTTAPTSWRALWEKNPQAWGLQGGASTVLLEITAATFFEGSKTLQTKEGIDRVIAKIAELKPNAKIWWTDEGTMQTALQNDEVKGGLYYHDVSMIMKGEGTPVLSTFPQEGAVQGYNSWCLPKAGQSADEAQEFLNWSCTPECHQLIARGVGAAPLLPRAKLNLTDAEFAAVSSESTPILVDAAVKVKYADYLAQQFLKMLTV